MDEKIHVTILSPRSIRRRYLTGEARGTRMAKWALRAVNNGQEIACVYRKGLNYANVRALISNPYGLDDAEEVLKNYLNRHKGLGHWSLSCIDMSNPDAFYFTFKRWEDMSAFRKGKVDKQS